MLARHVSRELALIILSQLDKDIKEYSRDDFTSLTLKSLRVLINSAYEDLKLAAASIVDMSDYIDDYEGNHPTNLERPLGVNDVPVPIPLTSDMQGRLNQISDVCEKAFIALEIAEMSVLEEKTDTKKYLHKIQYGRC